MPRGEGPHYEDAASAMRRIEQSPEYQRARAEQQRRRVAWMEEIDREGRLMLEDLRAAGLPFDDYNYPFKTSTPQTVMQQAVPVLLRWFERADSSELRSLIASYLATDGAGPFAVDPAIALIVTEGDPGVRERLADLVSRFAEEKHTDDIIRLLKDSRLGFARTYLPLAFLRIKNPRCVTALVDALESPDTLRNSIVVLGKLRAPEAIWHLRRFWDAEDRHVRRHARTAIRAIEAKVRRGRNASRAR